MVVQTLVLSKWTHTHILSLSFSHTGTLFLSLLRTHSSPSPEAGVTILNNMGAGKSKVVWKVRVEGIRAAVNIIGT
jgi:hypothetical protein